MAKRKDRDLLPGEYIVSFSGRTFMETLEDRVGALFCAVFFPCLWWYFAPDYSRLLHVPLGQLTGEEVVWMVWFAVLLVLVGRWVIGCLYTVFTGRDSVWFWHPD